MSHLPGTSVFAQGTFQNLDFESASVAPSPPAGYPNPVSISAAIPGWMAFLGSSQQSQAQYNTTTLGVPSISLLGPTWNQSLPGIIDGKYSVILQSGNNIDSGSGPQSASIEQNGTVPLFAQSLQFKAFSEGVLSVSFAGNTFQPSVLASAVAPSGQAYDIYGVNISAFAGQTGELQFTENFDQNYPFTVLDDIAFSSSAVPEPGPLVLTGIGGLLFGFYRRLLLKH